MSGQGGRTFGKLLNYNRRKRAVHLSREHVRPGMTHRGVSARFFAFPADPRHTLASRLRGFKGGGRHSTVERLRFPGPYGMVEFGRIRLPILPMLPINNFVWKFEGEVCSG